MSADDQPPPIEDAATAILFHAMVTAQGYKLDARTLLRVAARQQLPPVESTGFREWRASMRRIFLTLADCMESDAFFDRGNEQRN